MSNAESGLEKHDQQEHCSQMASKAENHSNRAFRLGRSALTGQFVLKPVGKPSKEANRISEREGEFSPAEGRVLRLAARRIPNHIIAVQFGLTDTAVKKVLDKAKRHFGTSDRVEAGRRFIIATDRQVRSGTTSN